MKSTRSQTAIPFAPRTSDDALRSWLLPCAGSADHALAASRPQSKFVPFTNLAKTVTRGAVGEP